MSDTIAKHIARQPIFDVHEHHMPQGLHNPDVGLIELLEQSYAGWAKMRSQWPADPAGTTGTLNRSGQRSWSHVARFVEDCRSSTFVRNIVQALIELYELNDDWITAENWEALDREIHQRHATTQWINDVLDRAGVERIVTDPYETPLLDASEALGARYLSVLRINGLAYSWHPDTCDHNGNNARHWAEALQHDVSSFDDMLDLLPRVLDTMASRHQVALKNALAYDRSVQFDEPDEKLARQAWGKQNPSPAEIKAYSDFMVDRICTLAGQRDIPVQMHLGLARIRGSHPLNAAGLIERHPQTRFLLMHLAYPWSDDLFGLAFTYSNIWLDLTWSWLISPTRFKSALHEAIEVLADEFRLMIGGDNWHVEETFGSLQLARQLIAEVLTEKVSAGYFRESDACRLADKILRDNARSFFNQS